MILRGTQLAQLWDEGKYRLPDFDETVKLCAELLFFEGQGIRVIRLACMPPRRWKITWWRALPSGLPGTFVKMKSILPMPWNKSKPSASPWKAYFVGGAGAYIQDGGAKEKEFRNTDRLGYQTKIKECPGLLEYEVKAEGK